MDGWKYINVRYNGFWEDNVYVGGNEWSTPVTIDPARIEDLRYNIRHMLHDIGMSTNFEIYRISSYDGSKRRICNDDSFNLLIRDEWSPVVYVDITNETHVVGSSSRGSDFMGTSAYDTQHYSTQNEDGGEFVNQTAVADWFGDINIEEVPSGSWRPWPQSPVRAPVNEDDAPSGSVHRDCEDDDIDEINSAASEPDASDTDSEENIRKFTFADCAAWIRQHGGFARLIEMVHPTPNLQVDEEEELDPDELENWLVPVIPLTERASLVACEENLSQLSDLEKGAIYDTKDQLIVAVGMWHMERGVQYRTYKSDNTRLVLLCSLPEKKCTFELRASASGDDTNQSWRVYKFTDKHTCMMAFDYVPPTRVHSKVVATYFAKKIRRDFQIIKPKGMIQELQEEFGIHIKYELALRARQMAIEMIYGGYDESFQMLPGYIYMLERTNPGTITDLDVGYDDRFQQVFVALGASRLAFPLLMRPVIVVDGTHLKGRNKGILFVAVTKDGNEGVYPLAYGVGPIENDVSWTWFLQRLRIAYGCPPQTLIVSDAHKSIANAVQIVFPEATHGLCYFHLMGKMKQWGKHIISLYQRAAYTYRPVEFQKRMSQIAAAKREAYEKLMRVGPEKWARSQCPVSRYSTLTSNAAESLNNRLLWARRLPICSMLESIRIAIEEWFRRRKTAAVRIQDIFTEQASLKLEIQREKSRTYTAQHVRDEVYNVFAVSNPQPHTVDLASRTCTCREFQMDGIPCSHAIAAIRKNSEPVSEYVSHYYTREALIQTYAGSIMTVPHRDNWMLPVGIATRVVLPPVVIRLPGRPRMTRARAGGERARPQTGEAESSVPRRRKCSNCHQFGHRRPKCPLLVDEVESD